MKVIDLLNKIANGEIAEDTMFEYSHGNGYIEYCTAEQFFNRYIVDKENLNLEIYEDKPFNERVEEIYNRHINYIYDKEDNKIEKLDIYNCFEQLGDSLLAKERLDYNFNAISDKINKIIDYINKENKDE